MSDLLHLTLSTGHIRRSPRSEVGDEIIDLLAPLVAAGGGRIPAPGLGAWSVRITREGPGVVYTVSLGEVPVVTCGLAIDETASAGVWAAMAPFRGPDAMLPTLTPWLAVALLGTSTEGMDWLGDFERCLAWTIMEETK